MGIFKELPLTNVQSRDKNFEQLLQANPMVEIGWQGLDLDMTKKNRIRFKFALVGELGMLSAYNNKNSAGQLFDYAALDGFVPEDLPHFFKSVRSFYSTIPLGISSGELKEMHSKNEGLDVQEQLFVNYDKPAILSAWMVGVKVSIMFELPKPKHCNCLQNNIITPWDKRRKDKGVE